jgi:hypothetical protein
MTEKLDLLLVNPGARKRVYSEIKSSLWGIEPPIWCGLIAAFVREHGYSVKIIDSEAENWSPEYTAWWSSSISSSRTNSKRRKT